MRPIEMSEKIKTYVLLSIIFVLIIAMAIIVLWKPHCSKCFEAIPQKYPVNPSVPTPQCEKCPDPIAICPQNWTSRLNKCYKVSSIAASYDDMKKHCTSFGKRSFVVGIHSAEEQFFVLDLARFATEHIPKTITKIWIGLNVTSDQLSYQWHDGRLFDFQVPFEPRIYWVGHDNIAMRLSDGAWTREKAESKYYGVCEKIL